VQIKESKVSEGRVILVHEELGEINVIPSIYNTPEEKILIVSYEVFDKLKELIE